MDEKRVTKSGDQLVVGDWLAPQELTDGAAEVLHTLAYPGAGGTHVHLVLREQGKTAPATDVVAGTTLFDLASEGDLAELRERAERAGRIADIRAMAAWLEANLWAPMPYAFGGQWSVNGLREDVWNSGAEGVAEVRRLAQLAEIEAVQDDEHIMATKTFGRVELRMVAWHKDGRPAEPDAAEPQVAHPSWPTEQELKPWESLAPAADRVAESMKPIDPDSSMEAHYDAEADPTGLNYSRADEGADPQPSAGRVDPRYVDVVDEPVTRYFSFGHGQTDPDSGEQLLNKYVTVVAPTAEACREAMFASRYGERWAFDYIPGTPQADEWIPQWTEHERIEVA